MLPCTFCAGEVARRQGARRQARHCRGPAAESAVGSLDSATEGPLLVLAYRQSLWMQSIPISSHPYPTNEVCADRTVTLTGYFAYARFLTSWSLVAKEARGRMGSSQVPLPAPVFQPTRFPRLGCAQRSGQRVGYVGVGANPLLLDITVFVVPN